MPDFTILLTDWARLSRVRRAVFIDEQGVPEDLEWDADDAGAVHLLAEQYWVSLNAVRLSAFTRNLSKQEALRQAQKCAIQTVLRRDQFFSLISDGINRTQNPCPACAGGFRQITGQAMHGLPRQPCKSQRFHPVRINTRRAR